jgi:hypothetical protein
MTAATATRWQADAACRGRTDVMLDPERVAEAAAICAVCPVVDACAAAAEHEEAGTWAGSWRGPKTADGTCAVCGADMPPAGKAGGRPRVVCSDRCRRERRRAMERQADALRRHRRV